MSAALRHRDFALLWSGQSISLVGDGVYTVALALETLRVDNNPAALSFVLAGEASTSLSVGPFRREDDRRTDHSVCWRCNGPVCRDAWNFQGHLSIFNGRISHLFHTARRRIALRTG